MSDISDPELIEERDQASRQNYKVYKRRWPVLMAVFTITLMNGLQKSILPIVDHFNTHMGMTIEDYDVMTQISFIVCLLSVLPLARALEHYKLRRMVSFHKFFPHRNFEPSSNQLMSHTRERPTSTVSL